VEEPERLVAQEIERHVILFQLVDRLPDAQARVIRLRFVEQRSIREIAQELGRSEGGARSGQVRRSGQRRVVAIGTNIGSFFDPTPLWQG